MREAHGGHEVLLKRRFGRRLDLFDPAGDAFDLTPSFHRQQRHQRAVAGGVAGSIDTIQVAVGDQPQDHRVGGVDVAAESACQSDPVDLVDAEMVHQQPTAGVQRRLGQLDCPDIVLGHDNRWFL